ncbi:MAG: SH3 domain-containing protein [Bacteroidetes bacterium]|nr:MAG: SH3 domain-containing protein [Bacteroidota bacterium]
MKIPKVESLIITIFFLSIALWAISKCAAKRSQLPAADTDLDEEPAETPELVATPQPAQPAAAVPQTYSTPATENKGGLPKLQNPPPDTPAPAATVPGVRPTLGNVSSTTSAEYPVLYVTIDGLKLRKGPNLQSTVITRLKLDESVYYLNEKSEKPEEINLGYETVSDYWVRIRTKTGKEGWVFGAGLHYFKMKRKGVME